MSAPPFSFIHKATCFDPSVGHLQAYIADQVTGAAPHWGPNRFAVIKYMKYGKFLCEGRIKHVNIFISVFNQLDAQNVFHNKYCFLPLHVSSTMCSSSRGQNCITQPLVSSHLQVAVSCRGWERTGWVTKFHVFYYCKPIGIPMWGSNSDLVSYVGLKKTDWWVKTCSLMYK